MKYIPRNLRMTKEREMKGKGRRRQKGKMRSGKGMGKRKRKRYKEKEGREMVKPTPTKNDTRKQTKIRKEKKNLATHFTSSCPQILCLLSPSDTRDTKASCVTLEAERQRKTGSGNMTR